MTNTTPFDTTLLDALRHARLKGGSSDSEQELQDMTKTEYENALKSKGFNLERIHPTADGRHKVSCPIQKCRKDILDVYEALYEHYSRYCRICRRVNKLWEASFEADVIRGHKQESSLIRYRQYYRANISGTDLDKSDLTKLKRSDLLNFYKDIAAGGAVTQKQLNMVKTLVNGVISHARDILDMDVKDLSKIKTDFDFKSESADAYTKEEQIALMQVAWSKIYKSVYARAISLMGRLDIRIGEVKGLLWSDVDLEKGIVTIQRQNVERSTGCIDRKQKGKKEYAVRAEPLTPQAIEILKLQKKISPFSERVFVKDGTINEPIDSDSLNRAILRYCGEAHIPYKPSHKLRFFSVGNALDHGATLEQMQAMSGHATKEMTMYYDRRKKELCPAIGTEKWAEMVDVPGCTISDEDIKKAEAL